MDTLERKDVPKKYCWDLSLLIKDEQDYQNKVAEIKVLGEQIPTYQNHLFDKGKILLSYLELSTKLNELLEIVYTWANLYKYEDLTNNKANDYVLNITNVLNDIASKEAFVRSEIISHSLEEFYKLVKEEPKLKKYDFLMQSLFLEKEHILSPKEEQLITNLVRSYGNVSDTYEILCDAEGILGKIKILKEDVNITQSNYTELMKDQRRRVRKNVFKTYYKFYDNYKNTISSLYSTNVLEDTNLAKVRKYDSSLAMALASENIAPVVYNNLINSVHKYLNLNHEYQNLRKKILKIKDYHIYDNYVEITKTTKKDYNILKCQEIIKEALKPLGSDYLTKLDYMFNSRYIDYYPTKNKRSGAFQWHKYVMLNHLDTKDSLTTMAHELGHAINTLYTLDKQPYIYQDNPIFLAEIASTLNEVLVGEYFYQNARTKQEKIVSLTDFLARVNSTIYRQTMFAEFEYLTHQASEDNISLTCEYMSREYLKLVKKYFTKEMIIDEEIKYEWMRIPHFYTSFYVYKYAIGLIVALIFAKRILNNEPDAVKNYLIFLASGSSDYPLNILKKAQIDLTKEETFTEAFSLIETKIKELKEVMKDE